ncbi:2-carboxy-1,4-naphthoquinone phytyltransferase [Cyanobacterium aponinum]|uniref:2-carboxy-1,4-naphthoquinone phytyltransferase n=1 Tax=Cyanobacterium aponinum 0216 TaxID=2676140 RepID=A0A844GTL0_9CHRO|nr:2-carboxy-1,4-naphthoquinone phytyltransferase [Cyanobacterium aponinum]MTF37406.1 2-carboxy-1,4-naphthoquinone phytyltransferase [Cyanobacterium aponinum 0216]
MSVAEEKIKPIVEEIPSKGKLWYAAIKPPMYTVAVIPICFGTALAYGETGIFNPLIFVTFLFSAILIIAWLNLSNDFFDSYTGIDVNKAHSVVNLTGNAPLIFWISNICLALGLMGIIMINLWLGDWTVMGLIFACCFLGYTYQGPPFRFGYLGLGEIICFITFGPMAIASAYYSQAQNFSVSSLWASVLIGISTSIILFCSHFHQVEDDIKAGKKSPIVRLGTANGAKVLTTSTLVFYGLCILFTFLHLLPYSSLIVFLSLPPAIKMISHVHENHDRPSLVQNSKFIAVKYHFFSGLLLSVSLILNNR